MYPTCTFPMNGTMWCSHSEANGMSRTITISSCSVANVTVRWRSGSSSTPEKSSWYMRATRSGVASRPSRRGSSPIASSSSATRRSTRWVSTLTSVDGDGPLVDPDVGQVAVPLGHVQPVAHHEVRGNAEADVTEVELRPQAALFHEQGAHLEARGMTRQQAAAEIRQREPAVHDVLDDEHVAVGQIDVEVLDDAHHAARGGRRSVGRHGHDVDLDGQANGTRQVAHEDERALQHADEQRGPPD